MTTDAYYATNVGHYDHVVRALQHEVGSVTLAGRWELTPENLHRLRRLPVPASIVEQASRRTREKLPGVERRGLGPSHAARTAYSKVRRVDAHAIRRRDSAAARHIARQVRSPVFQFVEGLGHATLATRKPRFSIMERRNLHHEVFEAPIEALAGFEAQPHLDPFREILCEEYQGSDLILVYSDVAKRSFLERGFTEEQIEVVPLGIAPHTGVETTSVARDPYKMLYVGRVDVYKGVDVAVAAVNELGPPFRLTIAGPAHPRHIEWMRRQPLVDYVGVLNRSQLAGEFATASRLVLPSVESFGFVVLEAIAAGLRPICRETTGVAASLPPEVARIVNGRDPIRWAETITDDLAGGPLSPRLAAQSLESLTWRIAQNRLREVYRSRVPLEWRSAAGRPR